MVPVVIAPAEVWSMLGDYGPFSEYDLENLALVQRIFLKRLENGKSVNAIEPIYQSNECYVFSVAALTKYFGIDSGFSEDIRSVAKELEVNAFEVYESMVEEYDY